MDCSTPGFPVLHRFCSDSYPLMPSNYLNLYHPLLPLPSIFPNIRVFSNELPLCIRWPKYWSFSFSINSFNEYSRLISFGIGWFDLFAVQRTFKSLLQHHSSKAPILQCSAFFMVQLSHLYLTTGKIIALTIRTFVGKVISLLFNILSRFVIALLPRSKHLLISWLQSPSTVTLESKKIKSATTYTFSLSIRHEVMGPDAMILVFWMFFECWVSSQFFHSPLSPSIRDFSSSLLSAIRVLSSAYLRLLIYFSQPSWFQVVLHPA